MGFPCDLAELFPASPSRLLELASREVDDELLRRIARADYGMGVDVAFPLLLALRDEGVYPLEPPFIFHEVLALTRWADPDAQHRPPFEPPATGMVAHRIRLFACAALLNSEMWDNDATDEATLAQCVVSAGCFGPEMNAALGSLAIARMTDRLPSETLVFFGLALLTAVVRLTPERFTLGQVRMVADLLLQIDSRLRDDEDDWSAGGAPLAFGLQQGLWAPTARELQAFAATIGDESLREKLEMCAVLAETG